MITQKYLKTQITYDKNTGDFYWNVKRAGVKKGSKAGYLAKDGYMIICLNRKLYRAHRLAWLYEYGYMHKKLIDHINMNPSDNRIENLREATQSENQKNTVKKSTNTSGYKGVSFHAKKGQYRATCSINKKHYHIGYFDNPVDAHLAYTQFVNKHYEGFAPCTQ